MFSLPAVVAWASAQSARPFGHDRLAVMYTLVLGQAALGSASALGLDLQQHMQQQNKGGAGAYGLGQVCMTVLAVALGSAGDVACSAATILREKDWLYHLAASDGLQTQLDALPSLARLVQSAQGIFESVRYADPGGVLFVCVLVREDIVCVYTQTHTHTHTHTHTGFRHECAR